MASDLVRGGSAKYVLAIGVERLSDLTDRTDRSTAFIFADGAGAAVVGPSDEQGIGPVVWGSDGTQYELISQKESWQEAADTTNWPHLRMDGNPVFRWAVYEMAKTAQQALDVAGVTPEQLDLFVPHQANMRITDAMHRALKLPEHVLVARDIERQGNTSAASIPLAITAMRDSGEAKSGDLALIIGFGAGLVYAAQVIRLP
jgi:3-oxoacyl-[acyl-carrier-protein] synthase-3